MISRLSKDQCCGCYSCKQACPKSCITMQLDEEGFYYPTINTSLCIGCGVCEKVCPNIQNTPMAIKMTSYALINNDKNVRFSSSSGGVFKTLAEKIIMNGGKVYGAAYNGKNKIEHIGVTSLEELWRLQKSKYLQSNIQDTYTAVKKDLREGKKVLFSGTPCQIKVLYLFLRKPHKNLLTVDIACHGVPSEKVWDIYLDSIFIDKNKPYIVDFRDKNRAWHNYTLTIKQENKIIVSEPSDKNAFMLGFVYNLYNRPSCHKCPAKSFTSGSDIMLADYWGIEKFYPEMDDNHGTSLVIVKTEKGEETINAIINQFKNKTTDFNSIEWRTDTFYTSPKMHYCRKKFLSKVNKHNFSTIVGKYLRHSHPLHKRIIRGVYRLFRISLS